MESPRARQDQTMTKTFSISVAALLTVSARVLFGCTAEQDLGNDPLLNDAGVEASIPADSGSPLVEGGTRPCDPTKPFGAPKLVTELNPASADNQLATL